MRLLWLIHTNKTTLGLFPKKKQTNYIFLKTTLGPSPLLSGFMWECWLSFPDARKNLQSIYQIEHTGNLCTPYPGRQVMQNIFRQNLLLVYFNYIYIKVFDFVSGLPPEKENDHEILNRFQSSLSMLLHFITHFRSAYLSLRLISSVHFLNYGKYRSGLGQCHGGLITPLNLFEQPMSSQCWI